MIPIKEKYVIKELNCRHSITFSFRLQNRNKQIQTTDVAVFVG